MSATATHPTPANDDADPRAAECATDTDYYRAVLHELIEIGADLARALPHQATPQPTTPEATPAQPTPAPASALDLATAYDRLTRAIRRTIALARTLDQPAPALTTRNPAPPRNPSPLRDTDRDTLDEDAIENDEDAVEREAGDPSEDALLRAELRADLRECLDDHIAGRPIEAVIAEICRDLGISRAALPSARIAQGQSQRANPAWPTAAPPRTAPPWAPPPLTPKGTGPPDG